ncbi:hypothetical protein [Allopusillimonas ginsengisoli]|uniref:hypothetical protein n=1 Tax=Allopusillimonas ginsengisoli TaxID=453575 RepID=UPI001021AAFF|nr:hypothetical protein [Allopusillimonas ginsengisoli]TEA79534.1 hypothetical protein ERE07_00825 [Allopusillimonas ginsengisoli]
MFKANQDIRLTDELERQLMMQAIEDQFRFKPLVSLKKMFGKLSGARKAAAVPSARTAHSV